ncbi:MAG: DUF3604 domain-containing protein [Rhodobiaceae bacterium]|nr:DUF3604 domain-containing protein [Rhodobiaceae bacterium]
MVVKTLQNILALSVSTSVLMSTPTMAADTQLLWGDTHLHTSYSTDAFMAGNRDADPDTAYRLAKGEPVVHPFNRTRVQLNRPLDFLVIADHAEGLGVLGQIYQEDPDLSGSWFWQRWTSAFFLERFRGSIADPAEGTANFRARMSQPLVAPGETVDPLSVGPRVGLVNALTQLIPLETIQAMSASMWEKSVTAAESHYEPGVFTPLIGWEWTQTANGVNLHRVVMSTLDGKQAATIDPVGSDENPYPEDLWAGLDALTEATGARFLSIPHNSNLSKGYMFADRTVRGEDITADYARTRMEWEPVAEVTQFKGDSETHPALSPDDEFADFEQFEFYLQATPQGTSYTPAIGDYARTALMRGLEIEERIGVNPFQFGMIGSTDSHTSVASAEEPNFWGKVGLDSVPENKRQDDGISGTVDFNGWNMSASGLAAVWAEENTRESIFEAFTRKEVYATTGSRIALRVFGGWGFADGAEDADDIADIGYSSGVPMGGDLSRTGTTGDPVQLLIRAVKDPDGANLDRVQVVKGWLDASGKAQEKVFDVVWSDGRTPDANGNIPAVGNTVDTSTGAYTNDIGAPELSSLWTDPTFDPTQKAFYYVRVLQIPTIRHSQLDATALGIATPFEGPATIQERAYSSPIWYKP